MPGTVVKKGAVVQYAIVAENAVIEENAIVGERPEDMENLSDWGTVTPGVRLAGGEKGDQVRVTTPERAGQLGSDYIVVGRPITGAEDPVAAWRRCVSEFMGGAKA